MFKNALRIIVVLFALYGAYHWWVGIQNTNPPPKSARLPSTPPAERPSTPVPEPPPQPIPASGEPRLAPDGTLYTTVSLTIRHETGTVGIRPGTILKVVKDEGLTMRVTDGTIEFETRRAYLTNDLTIAEGVVARQAKAEAEEEKAKEQGMRVAAEQDRQRREQHAVDLAIARRNYAVRDLRQRDTLLAAEADQLQWQIQGIRREPKPAVHLNSLYSGGNKITSKATQKRDALPELTHRLSEISSERRQIASQIGALERDGQASTKRPNSH